MVPTSPPHSVALQDCRICLAPPTSDAPPRPPASTTLQLPIEDVPLGARVPTKNPRPWEYDDSLPEPDEATWQVVKFTVTRKDGGVVDAELLRPRSWVDANGLEVGRLLPIDIEELQIEGSATVTAIEAAPAIATGEGSAVTGRFITRRVDAICRIEVLGADGQIDIIEGTTLHPIWSVDRDDWVPLGELEEGEQLLSSLPSPHLGRGIEGEGQTATILTHQVLHRTTPVYNIEIHGQHVYQVGALRFLVHNACALPIVRGATHGGPLHNGMMVREALSWVRSGLSNVRTNQALSDGVKTLSRLRPDVQGMIGNKIFIAEVNLSGGAGYHAAREAIFRTILGNRFGGYIPLP